jgi:uncharacterized protein (DUF1800 family)
MVSARSLGLIAFNRFGYGPRVDGDAALANSDPRGFLKAELAEPGIALLSGPGLKATPAAVEQFFKDQDLRRQERQAATASQPASQPSPTGPAPAAQAPATPITALSAKMPPDQTAKVPPRPPSPEQMIFRDEALARIRRAIEARVGFVERLVDFWSNHFCVSVNKGGIARATAGAFEREAIRPHVLGRFADMLIAVESHPAMLHFLDNAQSVGPNSQAGQRGKRGLNENLGREILELHTMGVGSGYSQADVTALAQILTGWTFVGRLGLAGEPGTFNFNARAHEPGPVTLLGTTYRDEGLAQGRAALNDLARRPETARFIARKFAAAFIADDPPPSLVARLAAVFLETDGDLRALTEALISAPEAWVRAPTKMRSPYQFLIATNRLLGHLPEEPGQVLGPLNGMGMGLWSPPGPNGYSQQTSAWASPEGLKLRLDYSALVASRAHTEANPSDLLDALCGGAPSPETRLAISRAESRQQGLALLLMSPEMQRS